MRHAKQQGVRISFDPNYRAPLWKNEAEAIKWMRWGLEQADLVKISEEELQMLFGVMIMASLSWQLIQPAVEMLSQGRFCIKIAGSQVGVLLRDFVLQTQ